MGKQKEIAVRFAGPEGMLIRLNNDVFPSDMEPLWNSAWLSCFPEEDERFFFGSLFKLRLETLMLVESAKNYKQSIGAFYKFDALLSGVKMDGKMAEVSEVEFDIVDSCIESVLGEPCSDSKLDDFILDNFYAFTQQKTRITLVTPLIDMVKNKSFVDLIMHPLSEQGADDVSADDTNLFKPLLFKLFPNLTQITLATAWSWQIYAINLLSLLSILHKAELPRALESIVVKDGRKHWLKSAFCVETQQLFAAKGLAMQWDDKEHLVTITA